MVWPVERSGFRGLKFTTADFFRAVRAEVGKSNKLDPRYAFTLTWSSSGTNGYRFSMEPGITGTFVAMSIFKRAALPSSLKVKGHPFFIYHSPQDFIPIAEAENARDTLQKAGAVVNFQTYEGGHGWRGDIFGDIRKGIAWLEEQRR
jgi:hypothetical protein